jgi:hypothetical protein
MCVIFCVRLHVYVCVRVYMCGCTCVWHTCPGDFLCSYACVCARVHARVCVTYLSRGLLRRALKADLTSIRMCVCVCVWHTCPGDCSDAPLKRTSCPSGLPFSTVTFNSLGSFLHLYNVCVYVLTCMCVHKRRVVCCQLYVCTRTHAVCENHLYSEGTCCCCCTTKPGATCCCTILISGGHSPHSRHTSLLHVSRP